MSSAPPAARPGAKAILQVAAGNFLEMYDFMVFGYYAKAIGAAFFPNSSPFVSLMLALTTYGAGFLMRPVGAIVLGGYIDRHGRRAGLLLSLSLMALGTLTLALTPGYATIGALAPAIVLAGRLVQGFSAGAELGGVSVYLAELAPPGRKGFYVAWQSASQQVAVVVAAVIGVILSRTLGDGAMTAYGWRIPLLFGCLLAPALLYLRRSLAETEAFATSEHRPPLHDVLKSIVSARAIVTLGVMLVATTTVAFYLITAYTPTFGASVLKLPALDAFAVTCAVGLTNLAVLPIMGALSDRIGRPPLLIACTLLIIVSAYPAMRWLTAAPSFARLLAVELWLALLYASYNGAMVAFLTEIIPAKIRATGFSLAYSMATAIFGGFTPTIAHGMIGLTHDRAAPGAWLSAAAVLGLTAALITRGSTKPGGLAHQPAQA